ncbi:hypothetical protein [Clostridium sp. Cult1]|nr:hypothetical protein [Clostridium sp. Cult1]
MVEDIGYIKIKIQSLIENLTEEEQDNLINDIANIIINKETKSS